MNPNVHYTCSIRGCADTASHLYHFTFQNRLRHQYNCGPCYQQNLRNDEIIAKYDPADYVD